MSNNKAKAYGLILGLKILRDRKINNAIIFGDSSLIIQVMVSKSPPKNLALNQILHRAKNLATHIGKIEYYHILREKNEKADLQENEGVQRNIGQVIIDGITYHIPIP